MAGTCNAIPEPESLKDLLELFSKLRADQTTIYKLQNKLNENEDVKKALEKGDLQEDEGSDGYGEGSADELKKVLENVHWLYKELVKNSGEYGKYKDVQFSEECEGMLFELLLQHIPCLFWPLQFLNKHVNNMSGQVGIKSWNDMLTTDTDKEVGKWLTDGDNETNVSEINDEDKLSSGLQLLKRGFTQSDLKENVKGSNLRTKLMFIDTNFTNLTKGLFLYKPWMPGKLGDMFAFLQGFCSKVQSDEDFRKDFEKEVKMKYPTVDLSGFKEKLQKVLTALEGFTKTDISDSVTGITPINLEIYRELSINHTTQYLDFLLKGIPKLLDGLKEMKGDMNNWNREEKEEEKGKSGPDENEVKSRFHYGFQGGLWKDNKEGIQDAISQLTGENGSLQQLLMIIKSSDVYRHPTREPQQPNIAQPSTTSTFSQDSDTVPSNILYSPPNEDRTSNTHHSRTSVKPAASRDSGGMLREQSYEKLGSGNNSEARSNRFQLSACSNVSRNIGSLALSSQSSAPYEGSASHINSKSKSNNGNSRAFVGGLLGSCAAIATGGATYAGNIFGFGDLVRGAFSGGAPAAANLRS